MENIIEEFDERGWNRIMRVQSDGEDDPEGLEGDQLILAVTTEMARMAEVIKLDELLHLIEHWRSRSLHLDCHYDMYCFATLVKGVLPRLGTALSWVA